MGLGKFIQTSGRGGEKSADAAMKGEKKERKQTKSRTSSGVGEKKIRQYIITLGKRGAFLLPLREKKGKKIRVEESGKRKKKKGKKRKKKEAVPLRPVKKNQIRGH